MAENTATATANLSAGLTAGDFLRFLDSEISRVTESAKRPGWTNRGILVALAGLFWLLTEELSKRAFDTSTIARLVVVLVSAFLGVGIGLTLFDVAPHTNPHQPKRFLFSAQIYSRIGPGGLCMSMFAVGMALLAWHYRANTGLLYVHLAVLTYSLLAFLALIVLFMGGLGIPLEQTRPRWQVYWDDASRGYCFLAFGTAAVGYASALLELPSRPTMVDLRLAAILTATALLLIQAVDISSVPPLLDTLVEIRRNLALDKVTLIEARASAERALLGLQASDVLQSDIKAILDLLAHMNRELSQGIDALDRASRGLPADQLEVTLRGAAAYRDAAIEGKDELTERVRKLKRRATWAIGKLPERPADTILAFYKALDDPLNQFSCGVKQFNEKHATLSQPRSL